MRCEYNVTVLWKDDFVGCLHSVLAARAPFWFLWWFLPSMKLFELL